MNQRPSLLDQAGISDKAAPARGASKGDFGDSEKKKLVIAGVLLLLAALGIAWGLGLFSGGAPKVDPEERAQREAQYEQQLEEEQKRNARLPEPPVEAGG
ncbi:MAG TPA: hypothetical protein VFF69_16585 [Phycisphaerales bacterium]|nr:hypothetical protein [Phycisphaerales bacterium]